LSHVYEILDNNKINTML